MLAILATPALAIAGGTLQQQPADASTQFCNKTNLKVYVAYARGETYAGPANLPPGVGVVVSDASTNYRVRGWWGLNPGGCATTTNESATTVVRNGYKYNVSHQYYAQAVDANNYWINTYWAGPTKFCVRNAWFDYQRSIGGFAYQPPLSCSGEYYQTGFRSFNSTKTNYTMNLLP
jgi:uncharacterized membrane protein